MYTRYPATYHRAVNHLIHAGVWAGERNRGRRLIARALRELRRNHGLDRAKRERNHMRQICGQFPAKDGHYLLDD